MEVLRENREGSSAGFQPAIVWLPAGSRRYLGTMNLTDREILELNELCGAVADGTLTAAQRDRLSRWLIGSEAARRHYVRMLGQSASLHTYASEMQAEAPDAPGRPGKAFRFSMWGWAALPVAAALVLGFWLVGRASFGSAPAANEFVARLTGSKNSWWASGALQPGERIGKNQRLELTAGFAELTFDSGARVTLEGPALLEVTSAWDGTLLRGTLKANIPREAIGFRISNPAVEVVDLGTEFTMIADGQGAAEVLVLKGEVEAAPRATADQETILLREKESRRFASSGMSDVSDSAKKFAHFTQPLDLDRFSPAGNYVHWSFDEDGGRVAKAEIHGAPTGAGDLHIESAAGDELGAARTEGRRARALRFNGNLFAKASFIGLSGATTHTIAFWVKVPEDAQLSDAYSMVTWGLNSKKLGSRHVGINWNNRPEEGPLGALRTDFRGGRAIGTTPLRDGQWHHITVVFAPGGDDTPVQVRQYVDGRLESSAITPDAMHGEARASNPEAMAALTDMLWLGCRLGVDGQKKARFRGEMDELFVADRALEPNEIVGLMKDNRLPISAVAVAP